MEENIQNQKNIYKIDDKYLNKSANAVSNIFVENMQQNHDIEIGMESKF